MSRKCNEKKISEDLQEAVTLRTIAYETLKSNFEPLLVTACVSSPVATIDPLHLDGILAYAVFADITGPDINMFQGTPAKDIIDLPLPLTDNQAPENRHYWSASVACFNGVESVTHWVKRLDVDLSDWIDFKGKAARIDNCSGFYKSYRMPLVIHSISNSTLFWYAHGDPMETQRLLKNIAHIGKKGSQGYGKIVEWKVEPHSEDWSCMREGAPMRAIPVLKLRPHTQARLLFCAYRPPYWSPRNMSLCMTPQKRVDK